MNISRNKPSLLSKPSMNYSYHSNNTKNIFDTSVPPDLHQKFGPQFNDKGLMKHSIIGKPEWFLKVAKQRDTQLRFINDDDSLLHQRKAFHKQRSMENQQLKAINQYDSISNVSSSLRTRKFSDHKEKASDSTNTCNINPINFDVVEQFNLIQQMKKIGDQIKVNTKQQEQIIKNLSIQKKLQEMKNQKAMNQYQKYNTQWQEFNEKLKIKIAQRAKQPTLLDQQQYYSTKVETLNMLQSIQNQLTDDEEEQKKKLNPLGNLFMKQRKILKLKTEPQSIKNMIHNLIARDKLFYMPNSQKLKTSILSNEPIARDRCKSEFDELNVSGASVYEKELQSIKQLPDRQNQRYKLFKHKLIEKSSDV
ncbi:unnamed protein product (macronuclear) [Paramecium tetraurelia]|uniref:Uncharacterized protein n=1 Tax=Paramecium tetraurelia TaxID=5888 RepID=A0CL66_PARTE|nr:uncharacterized protein GSPATT00008080001 [Paramecium tetraurelia]CAK71533.1 unnamed protein product [Paramecium tetraurelia]|eukprot:XP_001438930.1 hypothetical protein (macronuclear) [Paramecium tetraurelia strain d4-2]